MYDKLIQFLVWTVVQPKKALVMGGSWRIPVLLGLHDKNFVKDLKQDGTFNEASFEREYESIWSGSSDDAFFNADMFDRNRKLNQPEYEFSGRSSKNTYYVVSVDVGRRGCDTIICIFKVLFIAKTFLRKKRALRSFKDYGLSFFYTQRIIHKAGTMPILV